MEDVKLTLAQSTLQGRLGGCLQQIQRYELSSLEVVEGYTKLPPLPLHVKLRIIGRAGDHDQYAQGRFDPERLHALRQFQVTHHWCLGRQAQKALSRCIIQVFPRHIGQLGHIGQAQPNAQPSALALRLIQAPEQAISHFGCKDGCEEATAELLGRGCGRLRFVP